jgi:hypothetical protein
LRGFSGFGGIVQHRHGQPVHPGLVGAHKFFDGERVAFAAAENEVQRISVIHAR